jgi:indole-3-glycerol phosphate synthase
MSVLSRICDASRERVAERRAQVPEAELLAILPESGGTGRLRHALEAPGISVIAEFKRRSPSAGEIRPGSSVAEVVGAYEEAGASALSVLTEEENFGGSMADLREARATSSLPILRKDFTVDGYQVTEAAAAGADAVLLIVAALDDDELRDLDARARELGLDVLVEVHDAEELERAMEAIDPEIIGVNNRDLRDFTVDTTRTSKLMAAIPAGKVLVSESGITSADQIEELEQAGVDAVLVGERLMRAPDPAEALRELKSFGVA